jgi:hypothetical protein
VAMTLFLFMAVLVLDVAPLTSQAAILPIELAFVLAVARGHARLFDDTTARGPAWYA